MSNITSMLSHSCGLGQGSLTKCEKSFRLKSNAFYRDILPNPWIPPPEMKDLDKTDKKEIQKLAEYVTDTLAANPDLLKEVTSKKNRCAECGSVATKDDYLCVQCRANL